MRPLYLLMAIYVLGLSLMTCTDGMVKDDCALTTHFHAAQDSQHGEDEACSPFCVCSCCSNVVVTTIAYTFTLSPVIGERSVLPAPRFTSAERASVWQPPKIG